MSMSCALKRRRCRLGDNPRPRALSMGRRHAGGGGREHTRSAASAARPHLDGTVGHGPSTHSGPPPPLAQRQRIFAAGEWGEELPLTVRLRACELNRVRVKVHAGLFLRMCPLMFFARRLTVKRAHVSRRTGGSRGRPRGAPAAALPGRAGAAGSAAGWPAALRAASVPNGSSRLSPIARAQQPPALAASPARGGHLAALRRPIGGREAPLSAVLPTSRASGG